SRRHPRSPPRPRCRCTSRASSAVRAAPRGASPRSPPPTQTTGRNSERTMAMTLIAMTREMGSLGKDVAAGVAARPNRQGTNREAVENEIQMSEEAHTAITRRHFGVNWREPEHYDLVLSTERLSVDECVDEVESLMKKKRFQETDESRSMVENLALEWAVRAA